MHLTHQESTYSESVIHNGLFNKGPGSVALIIDGYREHGTVSFQDNKAIGEKYGIHPRDVESKKYFFS